MARLQAREKAQGLDQVQEIQGLQEPVLLLGQDQLDPKGLGLLVQDQIPVLFQDPGLDQNPDQNPVPGPGLDPDHALSQDPNPALYQDPGPGHAQDLDLNPDLGPELDPNPAQEQDPDPGL